jgi:hypothetical protein
MGVVMKRLFGSYLAALFFAFITGCGTTEPTDDDFKLNPKLHSVFYWGIQGTGPRLPNVGVSEGPPILNPLWVNNKLFFITSHLDENDILRRGIFEIEISPVDFTPINNEYKVYDYDYVILKMDFISSTNEFLMLVSRDNETMAIIGELQENQIIEKENLLSIDWDVKGITIYHGKEGFIFYGRNPQNRIAGFYSLLKTGNGEYQPQLLYAADDPGINKLNFVSSLDGEYLFFGLSESNTNMESNMQLLKLSLNQNEAVPEVIFERKGGFVYVSQNPLKRELLLINYFFGGDSFIEPQGHIELFNTDTHQSIDLDVRTHATLSRFIINEHPVWSPDGKHFAFSAGAFDGEGGRYDPDLWIYENVP